MITVTESCLIGYRLTGIKVAEPAPLCGELYTNFYLERRNGVQAVRGLPDDVLTCFAGTLITIGGLFVKRPTVHTATQSCLRQEMQQEASDEAIVVMKFL